MNLLTILIIVALLLTVATLLMGLGSMLQGGKFDQEHSGQLMFARVVMQAITLMLLLYAFYLANS